MDDLVTKMDEAIAYLVEEHAETVSDNWEAAQRKAFLDSLEETTCCRGEEESCKCK